MRFIAPVLLLALGALPVAAIAKEPKSEQPATSDEKDTAEPKKVKKICRSVQDTGSRKTTRICMTSAEWKAPR